MHLDFLIDFVLQQLAAVLVPRKNKCLLNQVPASVVLSHQQVEVTNSSGQRIFQILTVRTARVRTG